MRDIILTLLNIKEFWWSKVEMTEKQNNIIFKFLKEQWWRVSYTHLLSVTLSRNFQYAGRSAWGSNTAY